MVGDDDLSWLRAMATRRTCRAGEMIHDRGDADPGLVLVSLGRVKLVTPLACGRELFVGIIGAGQTYGDVALPARSTRKHRAVAMVDCELDLIEKEAFPRLLERPGIVRALYEIAAHRLLGLIDLFDDFRGLSPEGRLAKLLLALQGGSSGSGRLDYLQEDLASALGVSSVTLGKSLKLLRDRGLVQTGYRHLVIRDPAGLLVLAEAGEGGATSPGRPA